jgi:hypothetical protein
MIRTRYNTLRAHCALLLNQRVRRNLRRAGVLAS